MPVATILSNGCTTCGPGPRLQLAVVPRQSLAILFYTAAGACTPARYSSTRPPARVSSPRGDRNTELYYRPPSLLRDTSPSPPMFAMVGFQGVPTVRKTPRRPRERSRSAVDSIREPMAFWVFNRSGSPGAVAGLLTLPPSPQRPPKRTLQRTPRLTPQPPLSTLSLELTPLFYLQPSRWRITARIRDSPRASGLPQRQQALTFYPARSWRTGDQPFTGPSDRPVRSASAGGLPVRSPSSDERRPLPRS